MVARTGAELPSQAAERWLASRVSRDEALARLRGGSLSRLARKLFASRSRLSDRELPYLELLWLPYYLVALEGGLSCLVCGISGDAARIAAEAQRFLPAPSTSGTLPYLIDPAVAEQRGRRFLERGLALATRGRRSLPVEPALAQERWHYPVWSDTYERWRGRLDVRALDAITGKPAGARIRRAIVTALVACAAPPNDAR